MDEHHVLPPLVRGKLKGFLNFFIDEVKIFKNISGSKECEVVVQVQWWGDPSPALVRPKEFLICQKKMKYLCQKTYYHCVNYQVKTEFSLFQNYLNACEVLELAVLEVYKNIFIGSAFLKNLVKIIEQSNNDQIVFPIVDYLGETIGEMKLHTDFIAKNFENANDSLSEEREILIGEHDMLSNENNSCREEQNLFEERNSCSMQEWPFLPQNSRWFQNHNTPKIPINKVQCKNKEFQGSPIKSKMKNIPLKGSATSKSAENYLTMKKLEHNFPQVEVYTDFSKVLSFPIKKGNNCKSNLSQADSKSKHCSSARKNHISALHKSGTHALSNIKLDRTSFKKKSEPTKIIAKNQSEMNRKAELPFKKNRESQEKLIENTSVQLSIPRVSPISLPSSVRSDKTALSLPKSKSLIVTRESSKKTVLDYLLGFDMNREEENMALNDFKKMSPCRNFVETVSEFSTRRSISDSLETTPPENEKASNIHKDFKFNFDDPIERKYYETFFTGEKSSVDFEMAKMLNQHGNRPVLKEGGTPLIRDKAHEEEDGRKCSENVEALNLMRIATNEGIGPFQNSNGSPENNSKENFKKNKCAKCKYYTKLNELDTIIESLKNFEKNILTRETETEILKN